MKYIDPLYMMIGGVLVTLVVSVTVVIANYATADVTVLDTYTKPGSVCTMYTYNPATKTTNNCVSYKPVTLNCKKVKVDGILPTYETEIC